MPKYQPWRPFHETIVDYIEMANFSDLVMLSSLIRATKIDKNHTAITIAWKSRILTVLGIRTTPDHDYGSVLTNLLEQKKMVDKNKEKIRAKFRKENKIIKQKRQEEIDRGLWDEPTSNSG